MQRADLLGPGSLALSGPGMDTSPCAAEACAGMQDLQLGTSALDPSKVTVELCVRIRELSMHCAAKGSAHSG